MSILYTYFEIRKKIGSDPIPWSIHSWNFWDLGSQYMPGTIDSTTLIVTEHEFLSVFFSPDQSFSQSGTNFAVVTDFAIYLDLAVITLTNFCPRKN